MGSCYPPPPQPYYYQPPPPPKKKKRRLRKFICWTVVIVVVLAVLGVWFSDDEIFSGGNESLIGQLHEEGETWAIYWYLCGSDLESYGGYASGDLAELTEFAYEEMGDGEFMFFFEMADARGESATSEMVAFTVEDGEIYVEV